MFEYRFIKFQWNRDSITFEPIKFECELPFDDLRAKYTDPNNCYTAQQREYYRLLYGNCEIDVPKKSIMRLLIDEVLNPFYIFQVFAMALWFWDGYAIYATCIGVISTLSVFASLYETIQNNKSIREMARYNCEINLLLRNRQLKTVNSSELLPGDVIELPSGKILPCDLILLTGGAIVNEAMLTGESIPVMKAPLPYNSLENYSETQTTKHTLYSGTCVIQTRPVKDEKVYALVRSTGFLTTKGSLVRDILYPKEIQFKFNADAMKFVFFMAALAIIGFGLTVPLMIKSGQSAETIVDHSLDLITITVPPALPAAMSCGMIFAISRLKKLKIFCISPPRINCAGSVETFVFDKTGTLTEEGLSVQGFRVAQKTKI